MYQKTYFPNLDALRFLAFFAVYLTHCFSANTLIVKNSEAYQQAVSFFKNGDLGVSFFFVLSGFLITYLLVEEEYYSKKIHIYSFYMRRILRIWPLFFLCVLFGFLVYPYLQELILNVRVNEKARFHLYLTFLSNFDILAGNTPSGPPLGVLWSISVEEQFYLIWPLLLIGFKRFRVAAFIMIICISLLFRILHYDNERVLYLHTLSIISDMTVGGLIGWSCFMSQKFRTQIQELKRNQIVTFYLLGISLILFRDFWTSFGMMRSIERLVFAAFFGFVILEQTYAKHSLVKVGAFNFFSKWGKYTYGMYCLHILAIIFIDHLFTFFNINNYNASIIIFKPILSLLATILISWLSYHYFELYFLKRKHKLRWEYVSRNPFLNSQRIK